MNDDDAKVLERLRRQHDVLLSIQAADLIERQAAEIERLTPKPMTLGETLAALNAVGFLDKDWQAATCVDGHLYVARGECPLPLWAAIAIARAYEAQKETQ